MKPIDYKTTDDKSYYKRKDYSVKINAVDNIVKSLQGVNKIFDCGCNNGNVSYPLQKKYNKTVIGMDLSTDLNPPKDYSFINGDIAKINHNLSSDCTIFLSLYHHMLGKYGLDVADDIFYKLLFNSKYLIFDTGNVSESQRRDHYWYKKQKEHFKNEDELLNHFGVKYERYNSYNVGGGARSIVLFKNDKTTDFKVLQTLKRKHGSEKQNKGLFGINTPGTNFYDSKVATVFTQLKLGNKTMFGKKVVIPNRHDTEMENINLAYQHISSDKLIKFYGYHETYGFLFEWVDDFKYLNRTKLTVGSVELVDVDVIEINGVKKYIDFER